MELELGAPTTRSPCGLCIPCLPYSYADVSLLTAFNCFTLIVFSHWFIVSVPCSSSIYFPVLFLPYPSLSIPFHSVPQILAMGLRERCELPTGSVVDFQPTLNLVWNFSRRICHLVVAFYCRYHLNSRETHDKRGGDFGCDLIKMCTCQMLYFIHWHSGLRIDIHPIIIIIVACN